MAISNNRLLQLDDGKVSFRWKDYRQENRIRTMTLPAEEFIRRFLIHVLPKRFMRIRHFGFLSNRYRAQKLALCRTLLNVTDSPSSEPQDWKSRYQTLTGQSLDTCPVCRHGRMVLVEIILPFQLEPQPRIKSP